MSGGWLSRNPLRQLIFRESWYLVREILLRGDCERKCSLSWSACAGISAVYELVIEWWAALALV